MSVDRLLIRRAPAANNTAASKAKGIYYIGCVINPTDLTPA
ncbi:hypothetical protein [Candidatus Regiella insecticola]|nr:hypothetical protein [Candidatus Regiella insecticola]